MKKTALRKNAFLIGLLLAITLFLSSYILLCRYDNRFTDYGRKSNYLNNFGYARVFKVNRLDTELIYKKHGDPICESTQTMTSQKNVRIVYARYPAFEMAYTETMDESGSTENHIFLMIVLDETIQFGWKKIGIGSTKEEVHQAYAKEPMIDTKELAYSAEVYPDVDEGFYGEDWSRILFCYDDAGRVISMAYEPPAF